MGVDWTGQAFGALPRFDDQDSGAHIDNDWPGLAIHHHLPRSIVSTAFGLPLSSASDPHHVHQQAD